MPPSTPRLRKPSRRVSTVLGVASGALATTLVAAGIAAATDSGGTLPIAPRAAVSTTPGQTTTLSGVSFKLRWKPTDPAAMSALDRLAADPRAAMKSVSLREVAADTADVRRLTWKTKCSQTARSAVGALDARIKVGAWCPEFRAGMSDETSASWTPQGVAVSRTAQFDGLALSWYHVKDPKAKNPVTDMARLTVGKRPEVSRTGGYHAVQLAIPTRDASGRVAAKDVAVQLGGASGGMSAQGVAEAPLHAGGVSIVGNYAYLADTAGGLRVYDLRRTYRVTPGGGLGVGSDGKFHAHGEHYVLFETGRYQFDRTAYGSCPEWTVKPSAVNRQLCFSTVTYDPTYPTPSLLTAEYKLSGGISSTRPVRVVRWPLASNGRLVASGGVVTSKVVYGTVTPNVQGVAAYYRAGQGATIYYSVSGGGAVSPGRIISDRAGRNPFTIVGVIGGESFAFDPYSGGDRIWGVTEHSGKRMVYWAYRKSLQPAGDR
ncbi:hypothetical protein DZF91_20285 [Actinomadura logoneensis]|uniref:Secreted protein n=1 Tax=Actinomadura logoneensis TaxID=2293572 RepID=A0A372JKH6_9ACTN|nr:hypothetical protein [Actinomadura logoneensis]RFU39828.1 hypothetical protein DZF91_20285 [Actinomadura logoneensis]